MITRPFTNTHPPTAAYANEAHYEIAEPPFASCVRQGLMPSSLALHTNGPPHTINKRNYANPSSGSYIFTHVVLFFPRSLDHNSEWQQRQQWRRRVFPRDILRSCSNLVYLYCIGPLCVIPPHRWLSYVWAPGGEKTIPIIPLSPAMIPHGSTGCDLMTKWAYQLVHLHTLDHTHTNHIAINSIPNKANLIAVS